MIAEKNTSNEALIKGKAASYLRTRKYWLPTIPGFLMIALPLELLAPVLVPDITSSRIYWICVGTTIPFLAWFLVYWRIYRSVFVTAKPESAASIGPEWKTFTFSGWGNETLVAHLLESDSQSDDLVLYLHGYDSGLARGESRALHLHSLGPNVLGLDLRGFGNQGKRYDWTLLKVIADIEGLLNHVPKSLGFTPKRLWIYGHSMGGFLTLRLASHSSGWWKEALRGILLESPLASFPRLIDDKLPGRTVMAKPWVRHILRREYERIHPDLNVRYANSELPYSGIPDVPTLVVQAENDEVLGREHFELAEKYLDKSSDFHIIDMPHTSRVDTIQRQRVVQEWLNVQLEMEIN